MCLLCVTRILCLLISFVLTVLFLAVLFVLLVVACLLYFGLVLCFVVSVFVIWVCFFVFVLGIIVTCIVVAVYASHSYLYFFSRTAAVAWTRNPPSGRVAVLRALAIRTWRLASSTHRSLPEPIVLPRATVAVTIDCSYTAKVPWTIPVELDPTANLTA